MSIARSHLTRVLHLAVLLTVVEQLLTSSGHGAAAAGRGSRLAVRAAPAGRPGRPRRADAVLAVDADPRRARDAAATTLPLVLEPRPRRGRRGRRAIVRAVARFRAPPLHLDALSSAVHGLGLLLATFLAMSGAVLVRPLYRHALWAHRADDAQAGWKPDVGLSDRARVGGAPPPGARRPHLRPHVLGP